jgi:hypothetical protein
MTDRKPFAPMFTRSHDDPQPGVLKHGTVVDAGATAPARQTAPATGLDRVQQIGGTDGLADVANAQNRP